MKKIITLFLLFIFFSCSQKPEEIKLSDLGTACEYLDASIMLVDEANKIRNENKNVKIGELEIEQLKLIDQKIKDIRNAGSKKYTIEEFKECSSYEILVEKFHTYNHLKF
jgi:hypothetical protein